MDTQMLEAINYVRNVSKEKVTPEKIVTYLSNAGTSNGCLDYPAPIKF